MAEGRYNSPDLAKKAILAGADAVTIGSAITRIGNITTWFVKEIKKKKNLKNRCFSLFFQETIVLLIKIA